MHITTGTDLSGVVAEQPTYDCSQVSCDSLPKVTSSGNGGIATKTQHLSMSHRISQMKSHPVKGDGSCWFHSLAYWKNKAIGMDIVCAPEMRMACQRYLAQALFGCPPTNITSKFNSLNNETTLLNVHFSQTEDGNSWSLGDEIRTMHFMTPTQYTPIGSTKPIIVTPRWGDLSMGRHFANCMKTKIVCVSLENHEIRAIKVFGDQYETEIFIANHSNCHFDVLEPQIA